MSRLKFLREERNVKQEEMADVLGISACNYYKKENGSIRFSLTEAKKVADYFELSIEEIFFNNEVSKMETKLKETG